MAAADVFVLMTREDIWGLVINEALSVGTPIVSTNKCVAAVETIEDGTNGYIVNNEDALGAATKLEYLLLNEELREFMAKNNIEKARKYTIESMTQQYTNIINNFLDANNDERASR
ncbi:Glycosyltransferase [Butyrivibrio fibrisolvens 16/4]|nr:Glycosyltransferase [Butyrivibrio fibrisolvens 16/4]